MAGSTTFDSDQVDPRWRRTCTMSLTGSQIVRRPTMRSVVTVSARLH